MAGKAEQIIPRGGRNWLARVFMGLGPCRDAQAYLSQTQRDRGLGVYFEPSWMVISRQAQVQGQLGTQMHRVGNKGCCIGKPPPAGASAYPTRHCRSTYRAYSL